MKQEDINAFIEKHSGTKSREWLMKETGLSYDAITGRQRRLRLGYKKEKKIVKEQTVEELSEELEVKEKTRKEERRFSQLLRAHNKLKEEFEAALEIKDTPIRVRPIQAAKGAGGEATIVALLSDTHIEETVKSETVQGLNEYNLDIAEKRMKEYFATLLRLIEIEQQNTRVDNLVLALLGDYISNDIHDELLETCSLPPMEAILLAQEWLVSGIEHILKHSKLNLVIPCHSGNHARTTKKVRASTESGHSLEYMMYCNMAMYFKDKARVQFKIEKSYHTYTNIYDKVVVTHHGHNVQYGGGIGGITIPMNKAISMWNRARRGDIYCSGHFHQIFDGGNFVQNGSMIGFNPFAMAIKAAYEPPAQVMFGIHSKLGKYISRNIYFSV